MNISTVAKTACFLIALFILILSLLPISQPQGIELSDKINHLIAYFVLAVIFVVAFKPNVPHPVILSLISTGSCTLYGGIIEILQSFTPRTPELLDVLANFAGALMGTLCAVLILFILKKTEKRNT